MTPKDILMYYRIIYGLYFYEYAILALSRVHVVL